MPLIFHRIVVTKAPNNADLNLTLVLGIRMYIKVNDATVSIKGSELPITNMMVPKGSIVRIELITLEELNDAFKPAAVKSNKGPSRITLK